MQGESAKNSLQKQGVLSSWGLDVALMAAGGRSGVNAGNKTQHGKDRNDGAATVADQRQSKTDNRHDAHAHANIDADLEKESCCGTKADHTAHIVRAAGAYPDAAGNKAEHHNDHQCTAQIAKLFTNGRKNKVGMLGGQNTGLLSSVSVKQALAGNTAAGERLEASDHVVTLFDALRINGGIKEDENTLLLIGVHKVVPDDRRGCYQCAAAQQEPKQFDTAGKGHANENEYKDQRNTGIPGNENIGADQKDQMKGHVEYGTQGGYMVLVGGHDGGINENVEDFTDFRGLDVNGEQGAEIQPAFIAGAQIRTERDQQKQQEQTESCHRSSVFRKEFQIDGGHDGIEKNTQTDGGDLNDDITGETTVIIGAGDHQAAKGRDGKTHNKQYHIALVEKITQLPAKIAQVTAPFRWRYCTIKQEKSKGRNCGGGVNIGMVNDRLA